MNIKKYHIYTADFNPRVGTEPGKTRPVVVIQTDLLNNEHPSTIVFPITTNVIKESTILRVHLDEKETGLKKKSDILVDQIRALDNKRFVKEIGQLSDTHKVLLEKNAKTILFE